MTKTRLFIGGAVILIGLAFVHRPGVFGTPSENLLRFTVHDSVGVLVVNNAAPAWDTADAWSVDTVPDVRIGSVDGDAPYLFTRIPDAYILLDGTVLVVDGRTREIRLFAPTGKHIRTFGGGGEGPGEFSTVFVTTLAAPDTILVWDAAQRRLSWFTADALLHREASLAGQPALDSVPLMMSPNDWRLMADGSIVSIYLAMEQGNDGLHVTRRVATLRDSARSFARVYEFPMRTYPMADGVGMASPFWSASRVVVRSDAPSPVCVGGGSTSWEVRCYERDGSLGQIMRADIPRFPITDGVRAQARAAAIAGDYTSDQRASRGRAFDRFEVPDSTRAISTLFADQGGRLGVGRWQGLGAPPIRAYDVFETDGRWLGSVAVPVSLGEILSIADDRLLIRYTDELGVQYVHVHRLRKPLVAGQTH